MVGKILRRKLEKRAKRDYAKAEKGRLARMREKIINMKGKRFTGLFRCEICGHNHAIGYLYVINEEEHEICKFCNDAIFQKPRRTKIIYTPMGNNQ